MNQSQPPESWTPPSWHPDWGNAALEFEDLKSFAVLLSSVDPHATVELKIPEPGLMFVVVRLPDNRVAEVYSVPSVDVPDRRQLAIFFGIGTSGDEEIYADTIQSAVRCFSERMKG
jgi:hypothetical protein